VTDAEGQGRCGAEMCLTEDERRRILARLRSNLAWVGVRLPEHIQVDGRTIPLRSTMDRFLFDDHIDDEEREAARWLQLSLEHRAKELEEELAHDEMSSRQAEELLDRTIGILRAIDELKGLEDPAEYELKRRSVMEEVDDAERWRKFAKTVYGRDEYY
jgi:hypothetical protein